ncbi:hypothetical protein V8D89_005021, partial [Ganoderma adspersum]
SGDNSGSSSAGQSNGAATGAQTTNTEPPAQASGAAATAMLNAATSGGISFSPEQVQALFAVLGNNPFGAAVPGAPGPAPTVPVNAAAFPQFTFTAAQPASPGMSLLDLFPAIEGSVLLEIAHHTFKPGDLSRLDPRYKDRTQRQILDVTGGVVSVRDQAPRDYPTFHSLYIPLITYFDVLAGFAATGGSKEALYHVTSSTSAYLARLVQFAQEYQWSAVVAYHLAFHFKRRRDMTRGDYSGWASIDTGLQAEHLIGKERSRGAPAGKSASGGPGKPRDTDTCRNFNKGNCPSPCQHGRAHKCTGCGSADHGQAACTRA